jgi:pimeloyl-ACP methyl ester carboxylesterase
MNSMNDLIVVLPGILGSVLQKDGKDIWALSPKAMAAGLWTLGSSIKGLELDHDSADGEDLRDGVTAPRLMPDLHLVPGLWKIDGYSRLIRSLKYAFDLTPAENYFEFPYDWRRDNRAAARRLKRLSTEWLHDYRKKSPQAKLILVAHSMGGLVSRYFLECLDGWHDTRALITFGTPYRGSLKALDFIVNGCRKGIGPLTLLDLTELVRSFTSVYQLLPTYPCYDDGSGGLVKLAHAAGIPSLDQSRAKEAMAFHDEIAAGVEMHKSQAGYLIYPIVGTHQPTFQSARLNGAEVEMLMSYKGHDESGDSTVPRVSATPFELSNAGREIFASCAHASLQNDDAVWTNVEGILGGQSIDLSIYKGKRSDQIPVALLVEDAYLSNEPVILRARPERPLPSLEAQIVNAATKESCSASFKEADNGWMSATTSRLPKGGYRVTIYSGDQARPVADAFAVV